MLKESEKQSDNESLSQSVGQAESLSNPPELRGFRRWALMAVGLLLVFIAAVGVVLPGIPTTGPLILASICLTKSCPWLEQRLVRSRFFAPFHRYLDGEAEMPWRARVVAIAMMWTAISISAYYLMSVRGGPVWLVCLIVLSGLVGTVVITRIRRVAIISTPPPSE